MGSVSSARWWLALFALAAAGCGPVPGPAAGARSVSVAAAADLRFAFEEILDEFRRSHQGVHVLVTYGSSGNFFSQLLNQAPFDLYLSADAEYTRRLAQAGVALPDSEFVYGIGRIVLWTPAGSPVEVEGLGINALTQPSVRRVAIANPRHAPYGRAAAAAMKSFGVWEAVEPRLVFGENVAQTLQFVQSGNAEIGVVALALAVAPPLAGLGRYWEIPTDSHPRLEQAGVVLRWARDRDAAMALRAFLISPEGRRTLARYGFLQPGD